MNLRGFFPKICNCPPPPPPPHPLIRNKRVVLLRASVRGTQQECHRFFEFHFFKINSDFSKLHRSQHKIKSYGLLVQPHPST